MCYTYVCKTHTSQQTKARRYHFVLTQDSHLAYKDNNLEPCGASRMSILTWRGRKALHSAPTHYDDSDGALFQKQASATLGPLFSP